MAIPYDDVPEIDADAELDPLVLRHVSVAFCHPTLDINGTTYSVDDAAELSQHPIAGVLDDPPAVVIDLRVDE